MFNFHTYDSANFKSIGNNTCEKNATHYCAGPAYYRMYSMNVYCSKQTGSSSTKETITHHFFVSGVGRRKLSMQPKFVAARNVVKTETQQTFVKMDCSVLLLRHLYSAGSACIAHNNYAVAHRYGQLYLHCSLIYFWFLPVVFA